MSWDVAVAAGGVAVVLFLGGLLTEIGPWYNALRTPWWQPPGWHSRTYVNTAFPS